MRLSIVLSDSHRADVDPRAAVEYDRALVAAARGRIDGITLTHGWAGDRWNPQAVTMAAYLSAAAEPLGVTIRGLPLGVLNPVELAEQLATVDHAWRGAFRASVSIGSEVAVATVGVDPACGPARFGEGLQILRCMWTELAFAGTGEEFRFGEVRPTLRPVRPQGPPLSLDVNGEDDLGLARRHGLGIHLRRQTDLGEAYRLIRAWHGGGGAGEVSLEIDILLTTVDMLTDLATLGVDQVDVRVPGAGSAVDARPRFVEELARIRGSIGAQ